MGESSLKHTALYARLSRYVQDQTSTERQLADERKYCDLYGLPPGVEYVDVDLSAYKQVRRPAYERMLSDVQAGLVSHVVIWKIDRVARNVTEFMRFQSLCDQHGVTVRSVNDPYDTSTPIGMAIVQILAVFAQLESATIGMRVKSAKDLSASQGRFAGGGHRAFGLTKNRDGIVEGEAVLIRDAAARVLQGESVSTIAKEWRAATVLTTTGKAWTTPLVSKLLVSPHIAGLRVHKGETVGGAVWPAIIDRQTHEALVGLSRSRSKPRPRRSYLLSGLLACGECGGRMGAHVANQGRAYRCIPRPVGEGCGRLSIMAAAVDDYVTEAVMGALSAPEIRQGLAHPKHGGGDETAILDALRAAEGRLRELGEDWAQGMPKTAFLAATATVEKRIARLEAELARASEQNRVLLTGPDPAAEWERRDLTWRAALVGALFETPIVVLGAKSGRGSRAVSRRVRLIPRP